MKKKRWIIASEELYIDELSQKVKISKIATKVLVSRGYNSSHKINDFIASKHADLIDSYLLKDMEKAVSVIKESLANDEKIMIYGDYDVDGVTSTALLTHYFKKQGANIDFYIPNRANEGYGLNMKAIDTIKDMGVDLLITVDSGITAVDEVAYLKELGIKVVITDHHSCKEIIPLADAIVNHKQEDCKYPFKELAGVGVAFKLVCALDGDTDKMMDLYGDIVAIGTIADVMPIVGENRAIVARGIELLNRTEKIGLYSLMQEIGVNDISSTGVSFRIAPRINAAGRMGLATDAVKLLLTDSETYAKQAAYELCVQNAERQKEEQDILNGVLETIESKINLTSEKIIIIWGDNWHHGVVGIVSSRIIEKYNLPVIIFSIEDGMAKGSGRSIKGFNLFDALVTQNDLLVKYGGHELAAGMTLKVEDLHEFKRNMLEIAEQKIDDEMLIPELKIDCKLDFSDIDIEAVYGLDVLEPYGMKNAQPVFCTEDVIIKTITPLSSDKHLKIIFESQGKTHVGMLFSMSSKELCFSQGDKVCIAYSLSINEFRGTKTVQMIIKDICPSKKDAKFEKECIKNYKKFKLNEKLSKSEIEMLTPQRQDFVTVWRNLNRDKKSFDLNGYARKIGLNPAKLLICLDVFCECNLMSYTSYQGIYNIEINQVDCKVSLEDTNIVKRLKGVG
ncbi:MAG: single-stranded-DNA-specific exonuclease RecJ [Clostridia bacterium]